MFSLFFRYIQALFCFQCRQHNQIKYKIASVQALAWHCIQRRASVAIEKWIIWNISHSWTWPLVRNPIRTIVWHEYKHNVRANIMNMTVRHGQNNILKIVKPFAVTVQEWKRVFLCITTTKTHIVHEVKTLHYTIKIKQFIILHIFFCCWFISFIFVVRFVVHFTKICEPVFVLSGFFDHVVHLILCRLSIKRMVIRPFAHIKRKITRLFDFLCSSSSSSSLSSSQPFSTTRIPRFWQINFLHWFK